ncbi:hypothetical protein KEM52_000974 [Ascosphaera acerosa]|nr:hypothetical protein KEM52_000974 [Ascosphaera acerosa]
MGSSKQQAVAPPLSLQDIPHLEDEPEAFELMKAAINETIAEYALSFEDDVADVYPCPDWMRLLAQDNAVDNCNIRITLTAKGCNVKQSQDALEETLLRHPILLSFFLHNDPRLGASSGLGLYVVIKQSRRMLNYCIHEYGCLHKLEDARSLPCHPLVKEHSKLPGPLFNAMMFHIKETGSAALFLNVSHIVSDAAHMHLFIKDLELAIRKRELVYHPSYKLFADSFYFLRNSPAARAAVRDTIRRLQAAQIITSDAAQRPSTPEIDSILWPTPRMDFETFPSIPEIPTYSYDAPHLLELIRKHPRLHAKTIMKAATALVAMHENGSNKRAIFFGIQENRKRWPFVPNSFLYSSRTSAETVFASAADVPGPTWNAVINTMVLDQKHTALDFLYAVQDEQDLVDEYSSVPCYEVFRHLKGPETEKFYRHALRSLVFNWVPLLGDLADASRPTSPSSRARKQQEQRAPATDIDSKLQSLRLENMIIPSFVGCLITCAVSSTQSDRIVVNFQGAEPTIDPRWTRPVIRKLERVSLWLMREAIKQDNEGMARIGEFVQCMD